MVLASCVLGDRGVRDRLIDALWGEQPPRTATKIVQGYVSSLRRALGDGLLMTHGRGYVLGAEPGQIDVERFESLVAKARRPRERGDAKEAVRRLRDTLGLWRGPALAEFTYQTFAQSEIARLEESRLGALEDRIDAELALGEHARLVGELSALVREHPLRERFVAQLMLAQYRSGRQADALETYREARGRLVGELALEPGRELTTPSAGPYYVSSYTPGQGTVLQRNPNYRGSRPHGFARIELAVGVSAPRAVSEIQDGSADYTTLGGTFYPSTPQLTALASRLGGAVRTRKRRGRPRKAAVLREPGPPARLLLPEHAPLPVPRRQAPSSRQLCA
jgi:DNA-binding SARP family transcriptional activator